MTAFSEKLMHPVTLISDALRKAGKHLPEYPCKPVIAICALTGQETLCLPRKEVLGKSFTNIDRLAVPESEYVSCDVYIAWNYGYKSREEAKKNRTPERGASWFCDGETFQELTRQDVRTKVFQSEMPEKWTGYATTSYKKHGSLVAKVNTGKQRVWAFETRVVDCTDMQKVKGYWDILNIALRAGIGRSVMETLNCPPFLIGKVGLKTWIEFEAWAKDKYLSALYSFLCYLLPSQEELKNE